MNNIKEYIYIYISHKEGMLLFNMKIYYMKYSASNKIF